MIIYFQTSVICKNRNRESGNGTREMIKTRGIRVGTQGIRVETQRIKVRMPEIKVGMRGIGVIQGIRVGMRRLGVRIQRME